MASLFDALESEAFRKGLTARSKEANAWFWLWQGLLPANFYFILIHSHVFWCI